MISKQEIINKIENLKKTKNTLILTHYYQRYGLYEIADFIGDSLELSRQAARTTADIIVFCGVYFMAETAKILSPQKKVLLPSIDSGCLMADMIEVEDLLELKKQYPDAAVVCYVNSTAAIKAESDICCTSSNAIKVVQSLPQKKILFVPDRGLGAYVARFVPDKEIIFYDGFCPTHWKITVDDIDRMKEQYPQAVVLAHPECDKPVIDSADFVGSTKGILEFASQSKAKTYIIASEVGILLYMQKLMPEKQFLLATSEAVCPNMKKNTLKMVLDCLENETNEITVNPEIASKAYKAIEKMLSIY